MADVQPFRGLRYRADVAGDLGAVLSPPFDVIDAETQRSLLERSPHNIVRLELSEGRPGDGPRENRYTRAAATLRGWRESGALEQEEHPAFYVYSQQFEHEGHRLTRTALLARLRLEPWEAGIVRPHEKTGAAPKEDRLQLFRHLCADVSPLLLLYRDPDRRIGGLLKTGGSPVIDATTPDGQQHTLFALTDAADIEAISSALRHSPIYMADGHHRYETALAYRDERRGQQESRTGEEPENFVLVALAAVEDPGLVQLPTHRLVRPPSLPADLVSQLERYFHVEDATPKSYDGTALLRLQGRLAAANGEGAAFGALGLEEGRLHLLKLKDAAAVRALMPAQSQPWQALDTNVLEYAVLRETLGIGDIRSSALDYTEDATRALLEVESGRWPLAFLLNRTPVEQTLAVADAGELMPRKSTFFHPKLATGLVLYTFE